MEKVYYIVRYSVLSFSNAWLLSKDAKDFEEYKTALFEARRLNLKFDLFANLTVPSVLNQSDDGECRSYEIIVLVSDELPSEHLEKLRTLRQDAPLTILPVSRDQNFARVCSHYIHNQLSDVGENCLYATVRLDDDDVLAEGYEARLLTYMKPLNVNYMITFPLGFESYLTEEESGYQLRNTLSINFKKIALGLAHIGFYNANDNCFSSETVHVYQTGNHTKVDERFTLIYDMTPRMYVRVSYDMQDTKGAGYRKRLKQAESVPSERVQQYFPLLTQYI